MSPSCFPPTVLITRRPASLPRVLVGASSPASTVLSGRSDFLPLLPAALRCLRRRYHPLRSRFAPLRGRAPPRAGLLELVTRYLRPGSCRWRRQDLPRSWGTPIVPCPALRPRQDRRIRPLRCAGAAPAASTAKAPACIAFEAQSHGFGTGCLRFAGRVAPTPRKTRFRLLARLFRTGLVTRRVPTKGFDDVSYISSSFPKFNVAQGRS